MVNPVPGFRITTPYKRTGRLWSLGFHTGSDWAAPRGTRVVAAAGGRVVARAHSGSFGRHIVIESTVNGTRLRGYYAHLNSASVRVGESVRAGQTIGTVGSTGNSTGPHLHLEARVANFAFARANFRNPSVLVNVPAPGTPSTGGGKGRAIGKAQQRRWVVTAGTLNARSGPGTNYRVVGKRQRGHQIWGARETTNWVASRAGNWFAKRHMRRK